MRWNAKWNLQVLGLLGLTVLLFYTQTSPLLISGGYVVLSVSNVDYASNDPSIRGPAWLITLVQNGQGQYISGTVSKDQLKDADANVQAKNDVSIKLTMREMNVKYPISKQGDTIEWMEWVPVNFLSGCPDGFPGYVSKDFTKWCYKFTVTATYGLIKESTVSFNTAVEVSVAGKIAKATISNYQGGDTTISIKDQSDITVGSLSWIGNLVTGEEPPDPAKQMITAAYTFSEGGWKTIDDQAFQNYKMYRDAGRDACVAQALAAWGGDVEGCFKRFDDLALIALAGKPLVSSGGTVANTSGEQDDGQVSIQLARQIQFPVMTLRLSTAWVETITIVVPVGDPQILKATAPEFQTGSTGFITATVKNIGEGDGSFAVSVQCGNPVSAVGTVSFLPILKPSEQTDVYIPLSGNVVTKSTSTCTVNAYDRDNPDNKDSTTVQVTVTPIVLCTAGEKRINGNTIEQCSAEGSGWAVIEVCANDEEPKRLANGDVDCVKKQAGSPPNAGGCEWWDIACKLGEFQWNPFAGVEGTLSIVLYGILGLAAVYVFATVMRRKGG